MASRSGTPPALPADRLIGLAAAAAVWGGWVDPGKFTGFGMVQPLPGLVDEFWINTAIVLPVGIEAHGGHALRTWWSSAALSARAPSYAGRSALVSPVAELGLATLTSGTLSDCPARSNPLSTTGERPGLRRDTGPVHDIRPRFREAEGLVAA
jgi:hypothetical protein